jgi:hypothetical protein
MRRFILVAIAAAAVSGCGSEPASNEGNVLTSGEGMMKSSHKMPPVTDEGYLELKPGLWTRTASGGADTASDRTCIDATVYKLIQPERDITKVVGSDCGGNVEQNITYAGIKFSAKCGGKAVEGVMSGTDQVLHTEIKVDDVVYVVENKWSGDCPAGMAPGATG